MNAMIMHLQDMAISSDAHNSFQTHICTCAIRSQEAKELASGDAKPGALHSPEVAIPPLLPLEQPPAGILMILA